MKILNLLAIFTLTCSTHILFAQDQMTPAEQAEYDNSEMKGYFKHFTVYKKTAPIKQDLNCDGKPEKIYFEKNKILLEDGATGKQTVLGKHKSFSYHGKSFDWVDYWAVVTDKTSFKTVGENNPKEVKISIPCNAIALMRRESGGGLVMFSNGEYIWVQQAL